VDLQIPNSNIILVSKMHLVSCIIHTKEEPFVLWSRFPFSSLLKQLCLTEKEPKTFFNAQVWVWDLDRNASKSEVENTFTTDCFLNAFSFDQIGKSNFNANAKYSASFGCGASFNPSDIFTVYSGRENTLNSGSSSFIANSLWLLSHPLQVHYLL